MPVTPFDAVLFDCDGVLVDSEAISCAVLVEMLGELGWHLSLDEAMRLFVGKFVMDEAALIKTKTGVLIESQWLERFRERRNAAFCASVQAIEGARIAVQKISILYGGRIAVASSGDRVKVELLLQKVDMFDFFKGRIFCGYELKRNKPFPDIYLAAAAGLGVAASRCAVIEDTAIGVTAGVAAGATVFAYNPRVHGQGEALITAGAASLFEDMRLLPDVLNGRARPTVRHFPPSLDALRAHTGDSATLSVSASETPIKL